MIDTSKPHLPCETLMAHISDTRLEREKNTDNFRELYERTNDLEKQLVIFNTHLEAIGELSKILQRGKGAAWLIMLFVGILTLLSMLPGLIDFVARYSSK
jgi:hypothetical protein